jgi:hypothetical protein
MSFEDSILDQMKNIGLFAGNIQNANAVTEGVLTGLLAKKDEMPDGIFEQLDKSLKEVRNGKSDLKANLSKLEETLKKNGNNSSR